MMMMMTRKNSIQNDDSTKRQNDLKTIVYQKKFNSI
jgi:hypothetical protein